MGFAQLQVVAMGVVHSMAMGPAVVRNQQGAVQHKTHNTFDASVRMKGVVSTLMGEYPTAHRDGTCNSSIQQPERRRRSCEGNASPDADGQQRQADRHRQAAPGLDGIELREFRRQGVEQFSFAGVRGRSDRD